MSPSRKLLVLCTVVVGLGACSTDRTRNAGEVEGARCSRPGQVIAVSGGSLACGFQGNKGLWYRVDPAAQAASTCKRPGSLKVSSSSTKICVRIKGKSRWVSTFGSVGTDTTNVTASATGDAAPTATGDAAPTSENTSSVPGTSMPPADEFTTTTVSGGSDAAKSNVGVAYATPTTLVAEGVGWKVPATALTSDERLQLPGVTSSVQRDVTYSVTSTGTTGCSFDAKSMELSFAAGGECRLLAEVAPTGKYFGERLEAGVSIIDSCRAGIKCRVGDTGPGGGVVVYVASTPQTWGSFIEVAPKGWAADVRATTGYETNGTASADPKIEWCSAAAGSLYFWDGTDVGRGAANTQAMLAADCRAAKVVSSATINDLTDWVIPSIGDLEAICTYLKAGVSRTACRTTNDPLADSIGFNIDTTHYWSSSTSFQLGSKYAMGRRFVSTVLSTFSASQATALWVRPVRYFGSRMQDNLSVWPRLVGFGFPTTLIASGGNGDGAISIAVNSRGTANCSVTDGKISSTELGTCTVVVTRAASGSFLETSSSPIEIRIQKSTPPIWVRSYYGYAGVFQQPIQLEVSTAPYMAPVTFTVVDDGGTGCTVSGYELRAPRAGQCTVQATSEPDTHYNAGKSAPYVATFMKSCEIGGDCGPGSIGPGGGTVFFMTGPMGFFTDFRTGQPMRFMEFAPANWSNRTSSIWGCDNVQVVDADNKNPGGGGANTDQFLSQCIGGDNVFQLASRYRGGGKSDWYVPSAVELDWLCMYAHGQYGRTCTSTGPLMAGFEPGVYWSSSQYGGVLANAQVLGPSTLLPGLAVGSKTNLKKNQVAFVRPIRSFCFGFCPVLSTTTTAAP